MWLTKKKKVYLNLNLYKKVYLNLNLSANIDCGIHNNKCFLVGLGTPDAPNKHTIIQSRKPKKKLIFHRKRSFDFDLKKR